MSVVTAYQKRRREISTLESVDTLDHMQSFFGNGQNWAQHVYDGSDGGKCLVAAANHVRVSPIDDAKHWLRVAIKERTGLDSIERFNDTRSSFEEIKEIIARAKELARAGGTKAVALIGEVLPPVRVALPAPVPVAAVPAVQANRLPVAPQNPRSAPAAPRRTQPRAATRSSLWDWLE